MPLTYEIAVMNPRPLKKRVRKLARKKRAKGATMAMKRNRLGRFVKRGAKSSHRRRRRRRNPVETIGALNPRRRRRRSRSRSRRRAVARRSNPRRYTVRHVVGRRRRRRNPRFGLPSGRGMLGAVMPAAVGAAGAVGLDVALGYASFLPETFRSGWGRHGIRFAGALGLGWIASKIASKNTADAIRAGALTVVIYGVLREVLQKFAPTVPGLGDYEEMEVGYIDAASVIDDGTGAYLEDQSGTGAYMEGINDMEDAGAGAYMEF